MFVGTHQHTLDSKGRVSLPAKFRTEISRKLFITTGLDKNLYVFEADEYDRVLRDLAKRSMGDARVRRMLNVFAGNAVDVEIDSAGRISIPAALRAHAGIEKDVAVVGNVDRIELWSAESWAAYNAEAIGNVDEIAQELADAGLW